MTKRAGRYVAAFLALALTACSESKQSGQRSTAGQGGTTAGASGTSSAGGGAGGTGSASGAGGGSASGAGAGGAGAGGAGAGGTGGQPDSACPETVTPLRAAGTALDLDVEWTLHGEPLVFGEPNTLESGGTLTPLEVRFFVSEALLVHADSRTEAVDIVTTSGTPIPYGVHLVNAEDAASLRLRLLVPPGSYAGIGFTLGLSEACNAGSFDRNPPLSATSAMTWPPGFGYLFLRYAGMVTAAGDIAPADAGTDASNPPGAIHMGGLPSLLAAPGVRAPGTFSVVDGVAASARLVFDLGELFDAATSDTDVSDYPVPTHPEVLLGERVRRLAPDLSLFTLAQP